MRALKYQVLVTEHDSGHIASVPDLHCEAVGASVADAIATVQKKALRVLQEFEGATVGPPRPSRLTLALIELPAPSTRRPPRHLRLVHGLADHQPQRGSRDVVASDQ